MGQLPHPSSPTAFDWNEDNSAKLAVRYITEADVEWVHGNNPAYRRNKNQATGTWLMIGNDGSGRNLTISVVWADSTARTLRAITGWVR